MFSSICYLRICLWCLLVSKLSLLAYFCQFISSIIIKRKQSKQFISMNQTHFLIYTFYKKFLNLPKFNMGASCNPKPLPKRRPEKNGLQAVVLKCKVHLEMKRNKINAEIINGEKQLFTKINQNSRNRIQQLLIAQRVVNGLKYTAVCTKLIQYSVHIKQRSNLICENIDYQQNLHPYIEQIYSMMYCAERMNITSLQEFRRYMEYIDEDLIVVQNTNDSFKNYLTPQPKPEQMNLYFVQMSQRNGISLLKVNQAGHFFSKQGGESSGCYDEAFKQQSLRYRGSLQRKDIINDKNSNKSKIKFDTRKSIKNPFHEKEVQLPQNHHESEQLKDQTDEISPQITELMKLFKGS